MDAEVGQNREAWEKASQKHVREYDELLRKAATECSLNKHELKVLTPLLAGGPDVVHLQSGHGLDGHALVGKGAARVIGADYSSVAATAAQRRADELGVPCYRCGPGTPTSRGSGRTAATSPSHINDTFPANGAREWQWTLGDIVTTVIAAGLQVVTLAEHPEPFWRPADDTDAAAWHGRLPNSFTLVAERHVENPGTAPF